MPEEVWVLPPTKAAPAMPLSRWVARGLAVGALAGLMLSPTVVMIVQATL